MYFEIKIMEFHTMWLFLIFRYTILRGDGFLPFSTLFRYLPLFSSKWHKGGFVREKRNPEENRTNRYAESTRWPCLILPESWWLLLPKSFYYWTHNRRKATAEMQNLDWDWDVDYCIFRVLRIVYRARSKIGLIP